MRTGRTIGGPREIHERGATHNGCHPERSLQSEGSHNTAKSGPLAEGVIETNDWDAFVRAHRGDSPQTFVRSFASRTSLRMTAFWVCSGFEDLIAKTWMERGFRRTPKRFAPAFTFTSSTRGGPR